MLSPLAIKLIKMMPESLVIALAKKIANDYIKKYGRLNIEGYEEIKSSKEPIIFICNHLSNSDGLILNKILKKDFDPFFVAGIKLTDDPITNLGTKIVKHIAVKPNSADKEAITNMVKTVKAGNNLLIFPEGTRSRTGAMIEGKKGILLLARMTKAKIIPIGMSGTDKLLPINESGNMGSEKWHTADVNIKFGKPVVLDKRDKDEDKHLYDEKCLNKIMKSIAELLPESYRGVYK
ncbi:1-acyl-sn-glycerol-3-phosphate acyltransferase [Clostridium sp. SHJSY1]|uniref:lysophospholipid acyltransferase family protein n=1 Tax=Clostridium sp. SHJSY1 TaxID=2942483 RepID=UPI0028754837|nr:lysophospholipid acyltransferase family protein [Clostridium sp. SHJSY1]MDS0526867.1 1-acyl-sn-glycerol-3-phosphate acyltransferase [Clostridium sp. SHJSY1]